MSGHFIWDAVIDLAFITGLVAAFAAMVWWSMVEVLRLLDRHLRPLVVGWVKWQVRRTREWKKSRKSKIP